ncbi:MAG: tripartite tricarboxylate transporter substrate binding protein [Burkholderiales bacterium]
MFMLLALTIGTVRAQDWPSKPITLVMGYPAGSGLDVVARILQEPLEKALNTRIITDYRAGAGGNIGSEYVSRARADGYTILLGTAGTHGINAALYSKLSFDVEADFTPIASLIDVANVLSINPNVIDVKTVREFIDHVKANPGKYNYASSGNGASTHLAFAEFNTKAGLTMTHVPYKSAQAIQGLLKGDVCCTFNQVQTIVGHYRSGRVRLLGVSSKARVSAVPEIPTVSEAGLPGYESTTWFGFFGPKGVDPQIVSAINGAVRKALEMPAVRQRLTDLGNTPRIETAEQFRATVKNDRVKWATVVKSTGASVD